MEPDPSPPTGAAVARPAVNAAEAMQHRLRADLTRAMAERDRQRVSVLRTTMAAIANAEAPPVGAATEAVGSGPLRDHRRLVLSEADVDGIIAAEIADRQDTIERFTAAGRHDAADELRTEVTILTGYLAPPS